ncbi:hypothetical protein [Brachyspira murdochii]|uniref:Lipoprotein n=1 Tax=Brachyspira murdochii (strain ATCC 51284 / DSM 12563 / 56-150) TaxID=526224 RepID=D5U972_BRAM5|nr:hypothetical protein [Brachyspira murdochii]ADG71245.1 conserved hypothetical protein [Brachyspira murdochii DSM 12563]
MIKKYAAIILFNILLISCNASNDGTTSASSKYIEPKRESKGITNYIGNWKAKFANNSSFNIVVENAENILYNNLKSSSIKDLGNDRYKIDIISDKAFSVTMKFKSDTEGTIEDDNLGIGILTKD